MTATADRSARRDVARVLAASAGTALVVVALAVGGSARPSHALADLTTTTTVCLGIAPLDPTLGCVTTTTAPGSPAPTTTTVPPTTTTTVATTSPSGGTTTDPSSTAGSSVPGDTTDGSTSVPAPSSDGSGAPGGPLPGSSSPSGGAGAGPAAGGPGFGTGTAITASGGDTPVAVPVAGGPGAEPGGSGPIPPPPSSGSALAIAPAAGPRSTTGLIAQLDALHLDDAHLALVMAPFPVAGPAAYTDGFGENRTTPWPHVHQGDDVVAAEGTPVVASSAGVVRVSPDTSGDDPAGGNSIVLTAPDGTYFYYAHLQAFAPGLTTGERVQEGAILGAVGMTGDATGPHLHFEIHPNGAAAIDPTPSLDRWLSQAEGTARALTQGHWEPGDRLNSLVGASRLPGAVAASRTGGAGVTDADPATDLATRAAITVRAGEGDPVPGVAVAGFLVWVGSARWRRHRRGRRRRSAGEVMAQTHPSM